MAWSYSLSELASIIGADGSADTRFSRVSTDTRTLAKGDLFFALSGENFDGNKFVPDAFARGACAAVTTVETEGGVCLIVEDVLKALQRFAAHHRRQHDIPVFALTGSCGKTSTKDLTAAVLSTRYPVVKTQGNLNNEIGCPLSLLQIDGQTGMAVIEMGANHKGEIAGLCQIASPTESAITIIAPAHLEGFGSIENVAAAKAEIVEGLPDNGVFYVNSNDPYCVGAAEKFRGEKVYFGSKGDVVLESFEFTATGEARLRISPIGELRLPLACRAHATNVLLAVAVGLRHGVDSFEEALREACKSASRFKVLTVGPLTVIDDSYNANPASMKASLEALAEWPAAGNRIAALGEMLELGEASAVLHEEVGHRAGELGIQWLFAKGPHSSDMIRGTRNFSSLHSEAIEDPRSIAGAICRVAHPGDLVLVKGSRGMRMERVVEELRNLYA